MAMAVRVYNSADRRVLPGRARCADVPHLAYRCLCGSARLVLAGREYTAGMIHTDSGAPEATLPVPAAVEQEPCPPCDENCPGCFDALPDHGPCAGC